tara:strand:+ start:138 stop:386 length:249 start_codon:yes stop_codon:yes gene_type:complete
MKFLNTIFYSLIITFCLTKNAYAYLDPGAITAFIQLLVAGVAGALFTIKYWWNNFKNFVLKIIGKKAKDDSDNKKDINKKID